MAAGITIPTYMCIKLRVSIGLQQTVPQIFVRAGVQQAILSLDFLKAL